MTKRIIVELLGTYPQLKVDGQPVQPTDTWFELFMYIVITNMPRHDRDNLVEALYHPEDAIYYADPKSHLSRTALSNIPDEIVDICLKYKNQSSVTYDSSDVWVDVLAFDELAEVEKSEFGDVIEPGQLDDLLAAEKLYKADLVAGYRSDKRNFSDWLISLRKRLRSKYRNVLERLIRHFIVQQQYEQARLLAEKWRASAPDNLIPLQYLVWLNAKRMHMDRVNMYLIEMDSLQQTQPVLLGKPSDDWRLMFSQGLQPTLKDLALNGKRKYSPSDLRKIASRYVTGYGNQLVHIFDHLIVNPTDHFCLLVGASGSGKSAIAEAVGRTWRSLGDDYAVIQMDVTRDTSADDLLNEIATALDKPFLLNLMYENKRQSVFELLSHNTHLLVFDQEESGDIFSDELQIFLKRTAEYAAVLVCSEHHWGDTDAVTIDAVTLSNVNIIFRHMRDDAAAIDIRHHESDIVDLVGGMHEKLFLLAHTFDMRGHKLGQVIPAMKKITDDDPVLAWLWRNLDEDQQHVLIVMSLFDQVQRPTVDDIISIVGASPVQAHMALKALEDSHLVQSYEGYLRMMGVLHQYVNARVLSGSHAIPQLDDFQSRFVTRMLDFTTANVDVPNVLDSQRRNLIKAYRLALSQDMPFDIELFGKFVRYLHRRGVRTVAKELLAQFGHLQINWKTREAIEIRQISADIAREQGDKDAAIHLLDMAIHDAKRLDDDLLLAHLYHSLANATYGQADEQYLSHLELAKDHALASEDGHVLSYVYGSLGREAWSRTENELAEKYLQQSLDFAKGLNLLNVENFAATTLALIALDRHDYDTCQKYLDKAHEISSEMGNVERVAYGQLNQAALYNLCRQSELAMTVLNQALTSAKNIQNQYLEMGVIRNIGRTHLLLQNRLEAEQQLRLALLISQTRKDRRMKAAILLDLGRFAFTYSAWSDAYQYYRRALCNADLISHDSFAAEAFYGLCITSIMANSIIEIDPVEQTLASLVDDLKSELNQLNNVSIVPEHLQQAERYFRAGPENVPQLQHISIVDPIIRFFL